MIDVIFNDRYGAAIIHDVKRLDVVEAAYLEKGGILLSVEIGGIKQPLLTLSDSMAQEFVNCKRLRILRMKNFAVAKDYEVSLSFIE